MDDRRFDFLARAVAGGTRRGILRGLAGVVATIAGSHLSRVAAHHGKLGPGDACRTDSQCVAADAPLICADNGFAIDGPLNCCTYAGSRCGFDQGCCGDNACVDGFCTSISNRPGPGERCNSFSQCLAADTAVTCDYVAATDDYRCCAYDGGRCGTDAGCCGYQACFNGFCGSQGDVAGPGEPCIADSQCLAADTAVTCDYVAATDDLRCCAAEGGRCGWDGGCCGWLTCGDDGFCASAPVYSGPGDPCQDSSQCLAADASLTCGYVGLTNDFRCCAAEGDRCGWDGGCCGYARCTDAGFCTSLPPTGCDGEGCTCDYGDPASCAPGLVCCAVQSGFICATWDDCGMG